MTQKGVTVMATLTSRFVGNRAPSTAARPKTAPRSQTEDLLRDMAFVLHLTRCVKQSILKPT